jgi:hypothetical protein
VRRCLRHLPGRAVAPSLALLLACTSGDLPLWSGSSCRHHHVRVAEPHYYLVEAPEPMHGFEEWSRALSSLVEEFSEPPHRVMAAVPVPDNARDNGPVEFQVVAAGCEPDQAVGRAVEDRAAPRCRFPCASQSEFLGSSRGYGGSRSLKFLVPQERLELPTPSLRMRCSTN